MADLQRRRLLDDAVQTVLRQRPGSSQGEITRMVNAVVFVYPPFSRREIQEVLHASPRTFVPEGGNPCPWRLVTAETDNA